MGQKTSWLTSHSAAIRLACTNRGLTLHWKAPMATPIMPNSRSTASLVWCVAAQDLGGGRACGEPYGITVAAAAATGMAPRHAVQVAHVEQRRAVGGGRAARVAVPRVAIDAEMQGASRARRAKTPETGHR